MEFGKCFWNGLRTFSLGNVADQGNHFLRRLCPVVHADENSGGESWQDQVIKGPLKYNDLGRIVNDLFMRNNKYLQSVVKNAGDDDWKLRTELVGHNNFGSIETVSVSGEMIKYDIFNPFFKMGDDNSVGINIKANDSVTVKAGVHEKPDDDKVFKTSWWTSVGFRHSAAVVDAKVELFNDQHKLLTVDVSGKFGYEIGKVGFLAGIDLAYDNSEYYDWKQMCRSVSLTALYPKMFNRLTLQPYGQMMTTSEFYYKINDSFELAISGKRSLMRGSTTPDEWTGRDNDIGVKYTHSENVAYGLKSDYAGNVIGGAWISTPSVKLAITAKSPVFQDIKFPIFGIALEF